MPRWFPPHPYTDPAATRAGTAKHNCFCCLSQSSPSLRSGGFTSPSASLTTPRSIVIRAGHVIPACAADQLAPSRLQPLRTNRAIPGGILQLLSRRVSSRRAAPCRLSNGRAPYDRRGHLLLSGIFHGPPVIAHPPSPAKAQSPLRRLLPSHFPALPRQDSPSEAGRFGWCSAGFDVSASGLLLAIYQAVLALPRARQLCSRFCVHNLFNRPPHRRRAPPFKRLPVVSCPVTFGGWS